MRYPAREVDGKAGGIGVQRIGEIGGPMEEITGMVQRHDDHNDTAEDVDGLNPVGAKRWHIGQCWLLLKIGHKK